MFMRPGRPAPQAGGADVLFNAAIAHHQAGRLEEAASGYRRVLAALPQHFDARHLLGVIALQTGRLGEAHALISEALAINPKFAAAHNNLGNVYLRQGRPDDAAACFRRAVELQPGFGDAHFNLANQLRQRGKLQEAAMHFRHATAADARSLPAHMNLGATLLEQGDARGAASAFETVVKLVPDSAEAHSNLGSALVNQGKLDEAVAHLRKAIALKPDYAEAHNNLGNALKDQGKPAEAVASYRRAIALKPDLADAYNNLGAALLAQGKLDESVEACRKALSIKPDFADAYSNLGNAQKDQGRLEEAAASFRKALVLKPGSADVHSNLLLTMQYMSSVTPMQVFAEHQNYARRFEEPLRPHWKPHANTRDPERRLKVGYVSGDFRNHALVFYVEPVLASHDRSRVEVFCYYNHTQRDSHTDRIVACADHWLACPGMSDEQLAERIRADGIDVLVDLSGHTAHNRLPVFARKPAPVQATWIGYAGTTGLTAMDYRLTDAYMDPPGLTERYNSEALIRLPDTGAAYRPEPGCPAVNPLPALTSGELVFASLNNLTKINSSVTALWARLLTALPQARLMLGNVTEPAIRQRLIEQFGKAGIPAQRLLLQPRMPLADYLALHHRIDLALDPFPYNGGTTTIHSLWMGVPVITLVGEHTVSRAGVALLSRVGLSEFVTGSAEEYLQRAIEVARDLPGLNRIRQSLRERMTGTNCAPGSVTRHLEAAYRDMWRKWCAGAH